ncbi:hypothetical protein CBS101457_000208 [Exobasidium rhododendri]|nr:hypothetical protein CBS101457_000208 [Exobasidium rhododendri]
MAYRTAFVVLAMFFTLCSVSVAKPLPMDGDKRGKIRLYPDLSSSTSAQTPRAGSVRIEPALFSGSMTSRPSHPSPRRSGINVSRRSRKAQRHDGDAAERQGAIDVATEAPNYQQEDNDLAQYLGHNSGYMNTMGGTSNLQEYGMMYPPQHTTHEGDENAASYDFGYSHNVGSQPDFSSYIPNTPDEHEFGQPIHSSGFPDLTSDQYGSTLSHDLHSYNQLTNWPQSNFVFPYSAANEAGQSSSSLSCVQPSTVEHQPGTSHAQQSLLTQQIQQQYIAQIAKQAFSYVPKAIPHYVAQYEYALPVDAAIRAPYSNDDLVYHLLTEDQRVSIIDRVHQIRPWLHDRIQARLKNFMKADYALRLLSAEETVVEAAIEEWFPDNRIRKGRFPWMTGFTPLQRRLIIQKFADATGQRTDYLRDLILENHAGPDLASQIYHATMDGCREIATTCNFLTRENARQRVWQNGVSHIQKLAIEDRLMRYGGLDRAKIWEILGKPSVPSGYGIAILRADDLQFRHILRWFRRPQSGMPPM